jgi:AraC-like DNA-binding protein
MHDYQIESCINHFCRPDWDLVRSWKNHTFWHVKSGAACFKSQNKEFRTEVGESYFFEPDRKYTAYMEEGGTLSVLVIHFDIPQSWKRVFAYDIPYSSVDPIFDHNILLKIIENSNGLNDAMANKWLTAYTFNLCSSSMEQSYNEDGAISVNIDQRKGLDDICRMIANHPADYYGINELAQKLHVSPDHFSRLFKVHAGVNPKDYIINTRIQHAKGLLLSSSYNLEKIAMLCGYKNHYFFSRQFKEKTGITPLRYRRQS